MKPSNFQLINRPIVTKSMFQLNKEYNFDIEVLLEIDNNIKVKEVSNEEMTAIVILNLVFFKDKDLEESLLNLNWKWKDCFNGKKSFKKIQFN